MKQFSILLSLVVLGGLVCLVSSACATVVFQDDYQGYTVGDAVHNLIPPVGEGYYWLGANHYGFIDDNTTNPPGGAIGEQFVGGLPSLNGYGQQNAVITAADELAATDQVVHFNLDAYVVSTATQQTGLDLSTFASGGVYEGRAWDIDLQTDGTISIYDDNGYNTVPGSSYRTDTWVPVEVIADYAARTFQATVDGFTFGGNFSTNDENNTFRRISISEIGNAPSFFDNLLVTIPGIGGEPGDYNDNSSVDAADYVVWRNGTQPLPNEVATIGTTDIEDYTAWRERFGNPSEGGSGGSSRVGTVPEPTSALLALLAGIAIVPLSRRRRCG